MTVSNEKLFIKDFILLIWRHKIKIAMIMLVCLGFSFEVTRNMAKVYKSFFTIHVHGKYFKNPLANSIVPGIYSAGEMRDTIDSLIKNSLNSDFRDSIARKFGLIPEGLTGRELLLAKSHLKDNFNFVVLSAQTYQVDCFSSDPGTAREIAKIALDKVLKSFVEARVSNIRYARDVLQKRLESMSLIVNEKQSVAGLEQGQNLATRLKRIGIKIKNLKDRFSEHHPEVRKLTKMASAIRLQLLARQEKKNSKNGGTESSGRMIGASLTTQNALISEYQNLTLALEMERQQFANYITIIERPEIPLHPIWPKKRLVYSLGLIIGLILSFLYVFIYELVTAGREEKIAMLARNMNTVILGTIPKKLTLSFAGITNRNEDQNS